MVKFSVFNVLRERFAAAVILDGDYRVPIPAGTKEMNKLMALFSANKNVLQEDVFAQSMDDWCRALYRAQPEPRNAWRDRRAIPLSDEERLMEIQREAQIAMYMAVGEIKMLAMDTSAYDRRIVSDSQEHLTGLLTRIKSLGKEYRTLQLDIMEAQRLERRSKDVDLWLERATRARKEREKEAELDAAEAASKERR